MKLFLKHLIIILMLIALFPFASCARPLTAEESESAREHYEKKYANEPAPSQKTKELLDFLDLCVGGKYIFGGQGDRITQKYIDRRYDIYPEYFSDGRLEFLSEIAADADVYGWSFPVDYSWDCSGLWWDACNSLDLYPEYTDQTAHQTYYLYCNPISKEELRPGDIVFLENEEGRIVHMGIVGQYGYIYEAVSGFVGVVKKRTVDRRVYNDIVRDGVIEYDDWNMFGRPIIFEDK